LIRFCPYTTVLSSLAGFDLTPFFFCYSPPHHLSSFASLPPAFWSRGRSFGWPGSAHVRIWWLSGTPLFFSLVCFTNGLSPFLSLFPTLFFLSQWVDVGGVFCCFARLFRFLLKYPSIPHLGVGVGLAVGPLPLSFSLCGRPFHVPAIGF